MFRGLLTKDHRAYPDATWTEVMVILVPLCWPHTNRTCVSLKMSSEIVLD
jgi:hypothetical protein